MRTNNTTRKYSRRMATRRTGPPLASSTCMVSPTMDLPFAVSGRDGGGGDGGADDMKSVSSSATGATEAELLHGAAPIVYDNLRSGHFGKQNNHAANVHAHHVGYSNVPGSTTVNQQYDQQKNQHQPLVTTGGAAGTDDDEFVAVSESDADDFNIFGDVGDDNTTAADADQDEDIYYNSYHHNNGNMFGEDILGAANGRASRRAVGGRDVLALLLSGPPSSHSEEEQKDGGGDQQEQQNSANLASICEEAGIAARKAACAASMVKATSSTQKREANLEAAAAHHARAAAKYREAAVLVGSDDAALSRSLLLLSLAQARSASNVLARNKSSAAANGNSTTDRQRLDENSDITASTSFGTASAASNANGAGNNRPRSGSQSEERLRAKIRGAMDSGSKKEADMTDSMFLVGTAKSASKNGTSSGQDPPSTANSSAQQTAKATGQANGDKNNSPDTNPVDDMMKLESELRSMDFALEMGSSVASLGTRMTPGRSVRTTMDEGSFCVVPGSASYMSSSVMRASKIIPSRPRHELRSEVGVGATPVPGTAAGRAKANRVHGTAATPNHQNIGVTIDHQKDGNAAQSTGLESSWWGHPGGGGASHMASSIISAGGRAGHGQHDNVGNTKELMRLLDTIKTLGDENVALMREVEEAQAARHEAKVAKEQMKRFKEEYGRRFTTLKAALEKFRKEYAENPAQSKKNHQLLNNEFAKSTSTLEAQKKDQMIRQLAAELKKEKEDSKKKDAALRKYESFYREVKARSAQKAKQRKQEQQRIVQQKKAKAGIDRTAR